MEAPVAPLPLPYDSAKSADSSAEALSGYLFKKARNEKWQRRWFETQGFYLVYYKNRKMEKLLAALSLPQVGEIRLIPQAEDPEGNAGLFVLELNNRIYTLRANSNEEAEVWVRTMLKLREQGQGLQNNVAQQGGEVADVNTVTELDAATSTRTPKSPSLATPATAKWVKKDKKSTMPWCPCGAF